MTAALHLSDLLLSDRDDLTVEDVASLPEDLFFELINGRFVLTPAALPIHQTIGLRIAYALEVNCPKGMVVGFDQSVQVDNRNQPRPDVAVIRKEGVNRSPVFGVDVLLAVEVISPSSKTYDRQDKMKLYASAGIPAYWLVDPLGRQVVFTEFSLGAGGTYEQRQQSSALVVVEHPWRVTLDVPDWTFRRDDYRASGRLRG
jgi:Uma2 family endonuclease